MLWRPSKPCPSDPLNRKGEQVASQRISPPSCRQSIIGRRKARRPTEFRTLVGLVTALQRSERLAQQASRRVLSPQESLLLQAQITGLRKKIPSDVLDSYETVRRSDPKAFLNSQLFPLMVLLTVISVWAKQKPHYSAFQDHTAHMTFRVRRVKWPSLRRHGRHSLAQKKRSI